VIVLNPSDVDENLGIMYCQNDDNTPMISHNNWTITRPLDDDDDDKLLCKKRKHLYNNLSPI